MNRMSWNRRLTLVASGVMTALACADAAVTLDAGFDGEGLAFVDFSTLTDSARAVALQTDGKVVLAGLARQGTQAAYTDAVGVTRLNTDGSLDTTFGSGGKFTAVGGTPANFGGADGRAIAVQGDGRIVVAGSYNQNDGSGLKVLAMRLLANGSLDASFGTGGITVLSQSGRIDSIAIQTDGRIVLAGFASPGGFNRGLVMRLEANGAVDTTFGSSGAYVLADANAHVEFRDVRVLTSGAIFLAGTNDDLLLVRLTSAGQPDAAYAGDGIASANLSSEVLGGVTLNSADGIEAMALDADGSVVVAGGRRPATGNLRAMIARFTAAGELDPGFDTDGWRDLPIQTSSDLAYGVVIANDGSIVVAGLGIRASQFSADGTTVSASTSALGGIQAVTQLVKQTDGKVVGSGELPVGGFDYQFAAVRFGVTPLVTAPVDTTPNAFAFVDQAGVAKSSVIESAPVTITGLTGAASVTVTGGEFSVGCTGTYGSAASTLTNGQTICARHTSSDTAATPVNTTVTIGGVTDTFTSTTLADADTTPNAFAFTDATGATQSTTVVSNAITVSGITAAAPVTVTGGEYSIDCNGTFTAAAGTVTSGQTICVRHTSSAQASTAVATTLTVGGVSDTFTSTTQADASNDDDGGGAADAWLILLGLLGLASRRHLRAGRQSTQA